LQSLVLAVSGICVVVSEISAKVAMTGPVEPVKRKA